MTGFVIFIHAVVSVLLVVVILMQSGRGGGLTEGFASAESMFGAKTNEFMVKSTTVLAGFFLITCLGLAILNAQQGKSLMSGSTAAEPQELPPVEINEPATEQAQETAAEAVQPDVTATTPKAAPVMEDNTPPAENPPQDQ